ncbi:hypothetical protein BVY04_01290 [bacterium M21]|nr:hypothetical protein BVY04_01290 [bacterium M21]
MISIIIPTYNRRELLFAAINSVCQQTYSNWECLIVDDGSDEAIIESIQAHIANDSRCSLFERDREPKGGSVCRNIGLQHAKGDWIIFLDSDDLLAATCLELRIAAVSGQPRDFGVFKMKSFSTSIHDDGRIINSYPEDASDNYLRMFLRHDMPWQTTCPTWRRSFLMGLGGFDETFPRLQDVELHTRALLKSSDYVIFEDVEPDCFRRDPNSVGRSPLFYDQAIEGFTKYIRLVRGLLADLPEDRQSPNYQEDLGACAKMATDFLQVNKAKIHCVFAWHLLTELRSGGLITTRKFLRLLMLHLLPDWVLPLIAKTGISKLARRVWK